MSTDVPAGGPAESLTATVKARYGEAARRVLDGGSSGGCGPASCGCGAAPGSGARDPITADLYDAAQVGGLPADAVLASLGCGNPTALAELRRSGATLNVFMLGDDPGLARFVDAVARRAGGRVFTPDVSRLGEYVVADYLQARRGRR